jgi:hypothetical protein
MPKAAKQSTTNREATGAAKRAPKKRPSQLKTSAEKAELKLRRHPASDELRVLPVAALHVDSVILDDQPDHLVLTLRIPKAVIRNNIPLLTGLIDEGRLSRLGGAA